jgi:hypothetical protein
MAQPPIDARLAELIRAVEIRIEKQIEIVAEAICGGCDFERPVELLSRLTQLHTSLMAKQ